MRVDNLTPEQVQAVTERLTGQYKIIWEIGTTTGIRISDILRLKVRQFKHSDAYITEKKTGKHRRIYLQKRIRAEATKRAERLNLSDNQLMFDRSRQQVWRVFKTAGKRAGINTNIGTHTMRKSYSKAYLKKGHTIRELQDRLNHDKLYDTLGYLTTNKELGLDEQGKPRKRGRKK